MYYKTALSSIQHILTCIHAFSDYMHTFTPMHACMNTDTDKDTNTNMHACLHARMQATAPVHTHTHATAVVQEVCSVQ